MFLRFGQLMMNLSNRKSSFSILKPFDLHQRRPVKLACILESARRAPQVTRHVGNRRSEGRHGTSNNVSNGKRAPTNWSFAAPLSHPLHPLQGHPTHFAQSPASARRPAF